MEEEKDNSIFKLVNPEFEFEFKGKKYMLRRATLDKAISYQNKIKDLKDDPAADAKLAAYCTWIMLKEKEPDLTEEEVLNNIPADVDTLGLLTILGFFNPSKVKEAEKMKEELLKRLAGEKSSSQ